MPTHEQDLLKSHFLHAGDLIEKVTQQFEALRAELYSENRKRLDAEASRDLIRAHAQAALEEYRRHKDAALTLAHHHSGDNDELGTAARVVLEIQAPKE